MFPVGLAYVVTHTARAVVPENELGVAYEDVTFRTSDGLELEGWYIPSSNGAAVISFPGRKGPQRQARMLARHGYGVLLFDRRGEGESDGDPNIYGWGGDRDIKAAIDYLQTRPDVDPDRIGGIGLSVGGELMLEAAAETDELKAVVSEGAGARAYSDSMQEDMPKSDRPLGSIVNAMRVGALSVFDNQLPPRNLRDLVGRISPRPLLLIAAPNSLNGEELNRGYHRAAKEPKQLWEIPESKHVGGITRPTRRVRAAGGRLLRRGAALISDLLGEAASTAASQVPAIRSAGALLLVPDPLGHAPRSPRRPRGAPCGRAARRRPSPAPRTRRRSRRSSPASPAGP